MIWIILATIPGASVGFAFRGWLDAHLERREAERRNAEVDVIVTTKLDTP